MSSLPMSLLDMAVKKSGEVPDSDVSDKRTLIFVGSKSAGKTTMLQRFLEKNDAVKETLALEYLFGRKSGRSLNKDVCHIWELGGGTLYTSLLPNILSGNLKESTLVLVLDLSSPHSLWTTLESLLQAAHNRFTKMADLSAAAAARVPPDHPDADAITPFGIPLVLVGAKYDVFVNMDPEEKKVVTRTLRLVAHSLAASLFYYSDFDSALVRKLKEILNHHGFGGAPPKGYSTDMNRPVFVPFGSDSFENIGVSVGKSGSRGGLGLDMFKHAFTSQFPQQTEASVIPDDPAKDANFREPVIDQLRAQKDEELDRFLHELENKRNLPLVK